MKNEIRELLRKRAVDMAREPEQTAVPTSVMDVIVFTLASETYGIESSFVREVYPVRDFTPLPGVPAHVFGLINVRGQIMPVIDLKKFFNLPDRGLGELNKVVILQEAEMEFGILADVVHGTQKIGLEMIRDVPATVSGVKNDYVMGVTTGHLIILNAAKLLSDQSIVVNEAP